LETAAHRDALEAAGPGGGGERVHRVRLARLGRLAAAETGVRLVHAVVDDDLGGEVGDDLVDALPGVRPDAAELAAPPAAPRRPDVDADDLGQLVAFPEQLGAAGAELTSHAGHERAHQLSPGSGRRCGKRMPSRIVVTPASSMTRRSTPRPSPPVGGNPYSRARR